MEDKYLQVRKENIFTRFVDFIKGIFRKKREQEIPEQVEIIENKEVNSSFFEKIRVDRQEKEELLDLQTKYENNEIDVSLLKAEEIKELKDLYKRQIEDLKIRLKDKKQQLEAMKNKMEYYSTNI